jgi:hypothetical protein
MGKRILTALGIVIAIVLLGYVAQRLLFAGGDRSASSTAASGAAQPRPSAELDAARRRIVVQATEGTVERRTGDGSWQPLRKGDELGLHDQLRTGEASSARIELGETVSVVVADRTELNVAQLSSTLSRVRLDDGRIVSQVRGSKGFRFRVQVKGSDAVAESRSGKFAVLHRGAGAVTVAAQEGSVNVLAQRAGVRVQAGEQSVVAPGSPPSAPSRIPSSLLLKLGKPPPSRMRRKETTVTGETVAGATVVIDGKPTTVGADGKFTRTVSLREGANDIVVVVEDALGRRQEAALPRITVDSRAPNVAGKVIW